MAMRITARPMRAAGAGERARRHLAPGGGQTVPGQGAGESRHDYSGQRH